MSAPGEGGATSGGVGVMVTEMIVPGPARALAGLLGDDDPGGALPLPWHWVYLLDRPPQADLAPDGHPRDGVPSPPAPGMRRMFAGGRITTVAPLRSGAAATRETSVVGWVVKQGRSGALTFGTVAHRISQGGRLVIAEEQDIVYRPRSAPGVRALAAGAVAPAGQRFVYRLDVSATLLFRFSALTYNAHRIHYDRDYARDVEGYPGLLVHGPLQALAMAGGIARAGGDLSTGRFAYSLTAPLFDGEGLNVFVGRGAAGWTASVRADGGRPTATATAT